MHLHTTSWKYTLYAYPEDRSTMYDPRRPSEYTPINMGRSSCHQNTTDNNEPVDIPYYIYYYGLIYLITVVNIMGNSLVLSSWCRHKRLRCPANYFIFSLALSDLLLGMSYTVYVTSHMQVTAIVKAFSKWAACSVTLVLVTSGQTASAYNLVLLTCNRYLAVVRPALMGQLFTGCRSLITTISVWVVGLLLASTVYVSAQPVAFCGVCRYELFVEGYSIVLLTVITVVLPLSAMIVMYAHLTCITTQQVRRISDEASLQGPEYNHLRARMAKKNITLSRMAAVLVGYFALAWLPLMTFILISSFCPKCEENTHKMVRATARLLLHSNSAVNVFIYAGRHPDFREAFMRDLKKLCRCCGHCRRKQREEVPCAAAIAQTSDLRTMSQLETVHLPS